MNSYNVYLWRGYGYNLHKFQTDAANEEEAFEFVTKEVTEKRLTDFFLTEEEFERDFEKELSDNPEYQSEKYSYIDATMIGAEYPVYLLVENSKIELAA